MVKGTVCFNLKKKLSKNHHLNQVKETTFHEYF